MNCEYDGINDDLYYKDIIMDLEDDINDLNLENQYLLNKIIKKDKIILILINVIFWINNKKYNDINIT